MIKQIDPYSKKQKMEQIITMMKKHLSIITIIRLLIHVKSFVKGDCYRETVFFFIPFSLKCLEWGKYVFVTKYACVDWMVGFILCDFPIIPQKRPPFEIFYRYFTW